MGRQVVSLARRQEGKAVACPPDDALNQQVAQGAVDRLAQEKRKLLETIESEIIEAHRRMDRLFELLETFVVDIAIAVVRINTHLGRQGRLEESAAEVTAIFSQHKLVGDEGKAIAAKALDMKSL